MEEEERINNQNEIDNKEKKSRKLTAKEQAEKIYHFREAIKEFLKNNKKKE